MNDFIHDFVYGIVYVAATFWMRGIRAVPPVVHPHQRYSDDDHTQLARLRALAEWSRDAS